MFVAVVSVRPRMSYQQQHDTFHCADGLPSLLAVLDAILLRDVKGIIEYELGEFKADTVFAAVLLILDVIP
ncbi:hypothetical protein OKW39_009118 [Paraburkholderia sp. MM6662-R1]